MLDCAERAGFEPTNAGYDVAALKAAGVSRCPISPIWNGPLPLAFGPSDGSGLSAFGPQKLGCGWWSLVSDLL